MKPRAFLFGPFVGEMCWEFFRFAPYAIHLKKNNPRSKLIVLTRPSRFDLYGQYADILVPLRLKDDTHSKGREAFKLHGYKEEDYYTVVKYFKEKYRKRFHIVSHNYPDVRGWRYKVRWQFPREKMDYDFLPKEKNKEVAERALGENIGIVDNLATKKVIEREDIINAVDLFMKITYFSDVNNTPLGSMMECIRLAKFVIGDIRYDNSHLALLLGTPLIHVGNLVEEDFINLLNPLRTPVIISENIEQGVNVYETNF